MHKVSIILTSFNNDKYLHDAINSVLNQTFSDFELVIWDDCSIDRSWEIINSYKDDRIKAYRNQKNMGGGIVNRALQVVSGEYIAIHHSDDVWEREKLQKQVYFLDEHLEIGAVFTNALAIGEDSKPLTDPSHFYSTIFYQPNRSRHQWLNYFFYHGNALCHPSVLIRKVCYENCGLYRNGLSQLPDLDMWIRLCLNYEIHIIPEKLVQFRVRENEANTSGSRPETRICITTESYLLLKNFLRVETFEELVAIFPEANYYYRAEGFEPKFVLAMIALQINSPPWAKIFGIDLLFELIWNADKSRVLERVYGFTYKDIVPLTSKHDVFSVEVTSKLNHSIEERESQVDHLNKTAIERNLCVMDYKQQLSQSATTLSEHLVQIGQLNVQAEEILHSLSWKITRPLRIIGDTVRSMMDRYRQIGKYGATITTQPASHDSIRFNLESISLEESTDDNVLFLSGWCFSTESGKPVQIQLISGDVVLSLITCNLVRGDLIQALSAEEIKGSSVPHCGFQFYMSLNKGIELIEMRSVLLEQPLYKQDLRLISISTPSTCQLNKFRIYQNKELLALIQIYKKALGVVRWHNIFSLNNWKIWYTYAREEFRWSSIGTDRSNFMASENALSPTEAFVETNQIRPHLRSLLESVVEKFQYRPVISIIMPVYNVDAVLLEEAIASVKQQIYPYWELCIADDASTRPETIGVLDNLKDVRIKVVRRELNGHICKSSNDAAALATGEFIALMDNDDLLSPHALFEIVRLLQVNPKADLIYSDEDKIDLSGKHFDLHFKPDWSPTLLLGYNYINHLTCLRRSLFEQVGKFRAGYEGAQDYDLLLRITEHTDRVFHIPKILYHWRAIPGSTAFRATEKPIVSDSARIILSETLQRRGIAAKIYCPEFAKKLHVPVQQLEFADEGPTIEIIIPTFNKGDVLKICIESIQSKTTYKNYQIMVVNNASQDRETLLYLESLKTAGVRVENIPDGPEGFSFSRINNMAAAKSDAEFLLFLNNDTEVIEPRWLSRMSGYLQLSGVGATGARLIYPDNTIQHAGVLLGMVGGFIPDHAFSRLPSNLPGYFFLPGTSRESSAVTGACLLTRRCTFISMGGFDENNFKVSLNDVDFCLRLYAEDLSVIYVAGAELYHHESLTRNREDDPAELANFRNRYGNTTDPYYNPNLSRDCSYTISTQCTLDYSAYFKSPLKVVFFTHNLNYEGAPKIMMTVIRGLQHLGKIKPIIVSPCDGPARSALEADGFDIRIVKLRHGNNILLAWSSQSEIEHAIEQVQNLFESTKPDLVVTNVINTFFVVEAAKRSRIPNLWWIHESYDHNLLAKSLQSLALPLAEKAFADSTATIFVSSDTSNLYSRYNSRLNFHVIHNSLNNKQIFNNTSDNPKDNRNSALSIFGKKVIVCVGTVCERKDQATLVSAAQILLKRRADFILYIVGYRDSLPYGDFVKRKIEQDNLEDFVILVPETNDVDKYYMAADIFAFCSLNESYSLTILEAMAYGLPIVTTQCFGVAEQVRFGVNAQKVNFKDSKGLAEKLEFFLDNEEQRKLYGRNSSEMMKYMQTEQEMLNKHENMIVAAYQMR